VGCWILDSVPRCIWLELYRIARGRKLQTANRKSVTQVWRLEGNWLLLKCTILGLLASISSANLSFIRNTWHTAQWLDWAVLYASPLECESVLSVLRLTVRGDIFKKSGNGQTPWRHTDERAGIQHGSVQFVMFLYALSSFVLNHLLHTNSCLKFFVLEHFSSKCLAPSPLDIGVTFPSQPPPPIRLHLQIPAAWSGVSREGRQETHMTCLLF
jgi:hypothetical protein